MRLVLFNTLDDKDKAASIEKLIVSSAPRQEFFFMMGLSVLMATFGLLLNSTAVIIGSMLIAPLLYPLLGFSLGIVTTDLRLIAKSFLTIIQSVVMGVVLSALVTFLFSIRSIDLTQEILMRAASVPAYVFLAAIVAGLAGSYAFIRPHLNDSLPGVAISVALIPPISVVGIGIALLDFEMIQQSLMLLFVNIFGVVFASTIVFYMMKLNVEKKKVIKAVDKEEKAAEKEIKKIEKQEEKESAKVVDKKGI